MATRMKNGYRRPTGPLTYEQHEVVLHRFDGARERVVRWRVRDGKGMTVCNARSEADAKAFIKEAEGD